MFPSRQSMDRAPTRAPLGRSGQPPRARSRSRRPCGHSPDQRELIVSGDRLAPYYNERPFFDKPILFHWLIWRGQPSLARFVA
jgi:hypothetical protein